MFKANGRRYVGEFIEGRRHGKGQMTFPNGDKYTGDWVDGKRTGHGLYLFANGNRYGLFPRIFANMAVGSNLRGGIRPPKTI
jgi:hypothetical protein